jgi:3-deoxy-manno-octulosonate cytidylyltransferase (CMP-KDO synthetase)
MIIKERNLEKRKILVLIPARFASSRFPGKPLAKIKGISMIQRIYENCNMITNQRMLNSINSKVNDHFEVQSFVVTDDLRIEEEVKSFNGQVIRIDDAVQSGTERIFLAYSRYFKSKNYSLIVNLQGDEPLFKREYLDALVDFHFSSGFEISTLIRPMIGFNQDFFDPNKVKAIFSPQTRECLYFSRAPIPFRRNDPIEEIWYQHIGVYSFTPKALALFSNAKESYLEKIEGLEQLRALEIGLKFGALELDQNFIGVDIPEDIKRVEDTING